MCSAVDRIDVVRKGEYLFVVAVVVLHRHLDRKIVGDQFKIKRVFVKRALVLVEMLYEFGNAALVVKLVRLFFFLAFVFDKDADALVQKRLFAKPLRQFFKTVNGRLENARIRPKCDLCAAFGRRSGLLERSRRVSRLRTPFHESFRRARSRVSSTRLKS